MDRTFSWVEQIYPQHMNVLGPWVQAARDWVDSSGKNSEGQLSALSKFLEDYLLLALHLKGRSIAMRDFFGAQDLPSFTKLASANERRANGATATAHHFLNHVLRTRMGANEVSIGQWEATLGGPDAAVDYAVDPAVDAAPGSSVASTIASAIVLRNPIPLIDSAGRAKTSRKDTDQTLAWVTQKYPNMGAWRALAAGWLNHQSGDQSTRLHALSRLFDLYLASPLMPKGHEKPQVCLSRTTAMPSFMELAGVTLASKNKGQPLKGGAVYANIIHDFLNWVLHTDDYSETDDLGRRVVSPAFVNFVERRSTAGLGTADSSVRQALPYGLIAEARRVIAEGPNFSDWAWAQSLLGAEIGTAGRTGSDWYEVDPAFITDAAKSDPDFVWRERVLVRAGKVTEVWSPVRYVALLIKLILPLRTMQVRVLDSGEADTWRYIHPVEQATCACDGHALHAPAGAPGILNNPVPGGDINLMRINSVVVRGGRRALFALGRGTVACAKLLSGTAKRRQ
jgi:hypothetical protein